MTNNENDIDIDQQEDFEKEPQQKASLKETWDSNPLLKIAAVLLGVALLAGGYFAFLGKDEEQNRSMVSGGAETHETVGSTVNDPEYIKKQQEANKKAAQQAQATGQSNIPVPIAPAENQTLTLPATPNAPQGDPLAEWRAKTEAKRVKMEQEQQPEEKEAEQPEVVPMVTPIHPQPTMKMDPNAARQLAEQMRTVITSQTPGVVQRMTITSRQSAYNVKLRKDDDEARKKAQLEAHGGGGVGGTQLASASGGGGGMGGGGAGAGAKPKTIVTAGTIAYAQLINDLNSDVKGPALAQVLSGPFEGGRAIGTFTKQDDYLTLTFNHVIKDGISYKIEAIALDENTTLTGINSDIDHHYLARIILPSAADFIRGYAQAAAQPAQTQGVTGSVVTTTTAQPSAHEIFMKGVETSADNVSAAIKEQEPHEETVKLWHGTTMGLLFTQKVTTGDAEE